MENEIVEYETIDKLMAMWGLDEEITDKEVYRDIHSAMCEAYNLGVESSKRIINLSLDELKLD